MFIFEYHPVNGHIMSLTFSRRCGQMRMKHSKPTAMNHGCCHKVDSKLGQEQVFKEFQGAYHSFTGACAEWKAKNMFHDQIVLQKVTLKASHVFIHICWVHANYVHGLVLSLKGCKLKNDLRAFAFALEASSAQYAFYYWYSNYFCWLLSLLHL